MRGHYRVHHPKFVGFLLLYGGYLQLELWNMGICVGYDLVDLLSGVYYYVLPPFFISIGIFFF